MSVLRMRITINQKSRTLEQTERSRRDFLEQLSSGLVWDVSVLNPSFFACSVQGLMSI